VKAEFVSILAFRHLLNYRWGCGDIYFLCLLRTNNEVDEEIKIQEEELSRARWVTEELERCY